MGVIVRDVLLPPLVLAPFPLTLLLFSLSIVSTAAIAAWACSSDSWLNVNHACPASNSLVSSASGQVTPT